jgi:SEC-C motif-containing protein
MSSRAARKPGARKGRGFAAAPPRASGAGVSARSPQACPCGLPAAYADCCGTLHEGRAQAATAEQLMRSRYSAFAVRDAGYLLRSWHSAARPARLDFDPGVDWTGLEIVRTTGGSAFHTEGTVEFRAHYRAGKVTGVQHEDSRFVREDGRWVYAGEAARAGR